MGLCSSSFSLALNTYFKEKRNRAAGIGMTIAGLGPIFLPQLVSFLLDTYGTQGSSLLIVNTLFYHYSPVSSLTSRLCPSYWRNFHAHCCFFFTVATCEATFAISN